MIRRPVLVCIQFIKNQYKINLLILVSELSAVSISIMSSSDCISFDLALSAIRFDDLFLTAGFGGRASDVSGNSYGSLSITLGFHPGSLAMTLAVSMWKAGNSSISESISCMSESEESPYRVRIVNIYI